MLVFVNVMLIFVNVTLIFVNVMLIFVNDETSEVMKRFETDLTGNSKHETVANEKRLGNKTLNGINKSY